MALKTAVIIGGGITGLSAAYYLHKRVQTSKRDVKIIVVEADHRLGGKIRTVQDHTFIMEAGADSIVARKQEQHVAPLIEELQLQDEVVYNATGKSFIYAGNELKPIPDDAVFGIPMTLESLAKSELVSAEGKVEALKDFYTKNETFSKNDSIGLFLTHFLGEELVTKQISPVLSGVYSGKLNDLTIASTLPYLLDYKNEYGSIMKGLYENRKKFQGAGNRKFLSFKRGVSSLIDGLAANMPGVEILTGVKAERMEKIGEQYLLTFSNQQRIQADFVVMSAPNTVAQALLQDRELDTEFNEFVSSSLISAYLGFDLPDHLLPQDGTGFIVAENSDLQCNACTWTSRKWEHTSRNKQLLVRLFYKSANPVYEQLQRHSEDYLLQTALSDIEKSLGITARPVTYNVTKWQDSMPNYHIHHHELVQRLEQKLAVHYPNVILAGCSYYGVGIPDCIANGEKTAESIWQQL